MDKQLFEYLQGFLTPRRKELFDKVLKDRTRHFTVVAEDVYQMHNASAVMRSCEIFGVQDMYAIENRNISRVDKEIAMGAQKWVNLHRYTKTQDCINALRAKGYQIVATTPHNDSQYLHEFDVTKKSAFFFGQEKYGLSKEVMEQADCYLKIPMHGFTESLNISVSASIILQSLVTKMRKENIDWQLSEEEKMKVKMQWTKNTIKSIDLIIERYHQEKQKE